ncbi:hypothetical protein [Larkinella harenae]
MSHPEIFQANAVCDVFPLNQISPQNQFRGYFNPGGWCRTGRLSRMVLRIFVDSLIRWASPLISAANEKDVHYFVLNSGYSTNLS